MIILLPLLILLISNTLISSEYSKIPAQKDLKIFAETQAYINHLGKQISLKSEDINEGSHLLIRYLPILFGDAVPVNPLYLYPKHNITEKDSIALVQAWSLFFKELCTYRKKPTKTNTTTLKKSLINLTKTTKTIRQLIPFGTKEQRQLLKYAPYESPEIEELKERANLLQKKVFSLYGASKINSVPIIKPKHLYGRSLVQDINFMLTATENNPTLKQATLFFNGPHLWLIKILCKTTTAKSRLTEIGRAAAQENLLKKKLRNTLIRLCEDKETHGLMTFFSGSSKILELKNKKNQTLTQTISIDQNKAAIKTLNYFHFGSTYTYKYPKQSDCFLKKTHFIEQQLPEQDE